jgi:hypothetical protein
MRGFMRKLVRKFGRKLVRVLVGKRLPKGCKEIENSVAFKIVEESLNEGVPVKMTVRGDSMFPTLAGGKDQVTLHPFTEKESLSVGDVVLFRYKKGYLLHRVIEIPNSESKIPGADSPIYLKGDALTTTEMATIGDILAIAHFQQHSPTSLFWKRTASVLRKVLII